jgi:hypothetical protein
MVATTDGITMNRYPAYLSSTTTYRTTLRRIEAILGAAEAKICEILDSNFGDEPFHALR